MFIQQDKSDQLFYNSFLEESEKLQAVVKDGLARHYAFEDVATDLFTMLYEPSPKDVEGNIPAGLKIAKQNIDKIKELRQYQELHRLTQFDPFLSGIATESMSKSFINMLPKAPENPEELKAQKEASDELGYADTSKSIQDKIDGIEAYLVKADSLEMDDEAVRQKMRAALQEAQQAAQEASDALGSFGHDDSIGSMKQVGLKEKLELAKKIGQSKKLKEIAKLAGRFVRIARKKQKEKSTSTTINSIETGDNLARTLPSELGKLANPLLASTFYKGLLEKTLLQYKLHNKVPKGQGEIIVCVDTSGSTNGQVEMAEKAIALALLDIARREKRGFVLINFSSVDQVRVFEAPKGKCETLDLLCEMEYAFGGDTCFKTPLTEALKYIEKNKFPRADLLFITDGQANLDNTFLENYHRIKKEKEFSCIGVLVGNEAKVVQQFCDELFNVNDLLSDELTNEAFHERAFKI